MCCSLLGACKDVSRFSTEAGESYCGQIVSAGFVRRGFDDKIRMAMKFDADHLADAPGLLSTDDGLLAGTPMRPLPEVNPGARARLLVAVAAERVGKHKCDLEKRERVNQFFAADQHRNGRAFGWAEKLTNARDEEGEQIDRQ